MCSKVFHQCFIVLSICLLSIRSEEPPQIFLTAAKSVPRIGRSASKNGNSEFEKFFLKASKSVPRIGRGNKNLYAVEQQDLWDGSFKSPKWSDIAYFYEYQPELFASDNLHDTFEQYLTGDVPSMYGSESTKYQRSVPNRFNIVRK